MASVVPLEREESPQSCDRTRDTMNDLAQSRQNGYQQVLLVSSARASRTAVSSNVDFSAHGHD